MSSLSIDYQAFLGLVLQPMNPRFGQLHGKCVNRPIDQPASHAARLLEPTVEMFPA